MNELHTFTCCKNKFKFSVKSEFLQKCPKPQEFDCYDLMTKFKMVQYLHNPAGPALIRLQDHFSEYWMNGQQLSEEEGKKIAHNYNFNNKLLAEINE